MKSNTGVVGHYWTKVVSLEKIQSSDRVLHSTRLFITNHCDTNVLVQQAFSQQSFFNFRC